MDGRPPEVTLTDKEEQTALVDLRSHAKRLWHRRPPWMDEEDLIHVGWIAYVRGWARAKRKTCPPHTFAILAAQGEMLHEIDRWLDRRRQRIDGGNIRYTFTTGYEPDYHVIVTQPDEVEVLDGVRWALNLLSVRQQRVLQLLYLDGLTQTEAADALGITEHQVMDSRFQAISRLQELLGVREKRSHGAKDAA
jgi:RNA polymerase sigma factor (sigma-70 family)